MGVLCMFLAVLFVAAPFALAMDPATMADMGGESGVNMPGAIVPGTGEKKTLDELPAEDQFNCQVRGDGNYANVFVICSDHYFRCEEGNAYKVTCPTKTRWSQREGRCLSPVHVPGCPLTCTDRPNGFYANPDDCRHFFFCINNLEFVLACRHNQVFHPTTNRCVFPEKAPSPCGTFVAGGPQTPKFTCEGRLDGRYPKSGDCEMFYECAEGVMTPGQCEGGMAFSQNLRDCVEQTAVPGCYPPEARSFFNFCFGRADGVYALTDNCHGYRACVQNRPFAFFCDPIHTPDFDIKTLSCVAAQAGCTLPATEAPIVEPTEPTVAPPLGETVTPFGETVTPFGETVTPIGETVSPKIEETLAPGQTPTPTGSPAPGLPNQS